MVEARRRSVVKSVLWRVIGIGWTWLGAYLILRFAPERYRGAAWVASAIVVFHHSTRMLMYYCYERLWNRIGWGRLVMRGNAPGE